MITHSKESSMHECRAIYIQIKNVKNCNSRFTLKGDLQTNFIRNFIRNFIYIYIYIITEINVVCCVGRVEIQIEI